MSFAGLASCGLVWLAIYDNHGLAGLGTVIVNELRAYRSALMWCCESSQTVFCLSGKT